MENENDEPDDDDGWDVEKITVAARLAVAEELLKKKLLGYPIVTWRDDRIVTIPPEEIAVSREIVEDLKKQLAAFDE